MWIAGVFDAYIYSGNDREDESFLQIARPILVGIAMFLSFIILLLAMFLENHEYKGVKPYSEALGTDTGFYDVPANSVEPDVSKGTVEGQLGQPYPDSSGQTAAESESLLNQPDIKEGIDSENYISIQVGAFSTQNEADKLSRRLSDKGYSVEIVSPANSDTQKLYKVRVGKFQREDNALRIAQILSKNEKVPTILFIVTE